jgi:hypothetical protein
MGGLGNLMFYLYAESDTEEVEEAEEGWVVLVTPPCR